jgi:hypothetical protein
MPREKCPEWQHVILLEEGASLTASKLQCAYCKKEFKGGVGRIRAHLMGDSKQGIAKCKSVPEIILSQLRNEEAARKEDEVRKRKLLAIDKATTSSPSNLKQMKLPLMVTINEKTAADKALARLFYANGLPFAIADSKYFKEAMSAVCHAGPNYKPPNREAISGNMLKSEVNNIDLKLAGYKQENTLTGVTLVSDGWTNVQNRPIINFLIVSGDGAMFVDATDTSGAVKDAKYIADIIGRHIEAVGKEHIVQVVTDSAANCVSARKQLAEIYPQIVFAPCAAHCLDLLLEDIGKLTWITAIIDQGHDIVKFITTHQSSQAFFRSHSTLELLKPVATRFASFFIMLQRVQECKDSLQETVVDREYKLWLTNASYKETGQTITKIILSNEFWQSVAQILSLCEPIVCLLRLVDGNKPCTGKIYWKMFQLCQKIEQSDLPGARRKPIHQLAMERWKMLHNDLHAAGFVLDPEYCEFLQHENDEVVSGFHSVVERIYSDNVQAQVRAIEQHAIYRARQGLFARSMAIEAAKTMPAHRWWLSFGAHVPELQKVAVRVLAQVASASACERNWSTFDFIHTKKRNRLRSTKVRDVVYVHCNLRLTEKLENVNRVMDTVQWDKDNDDATDSGSEIE